MNQQKQRLSGATIYIATIGACMGMAIERRTSLLQSEQTVRLNGPCGEDKKLSVLENLGTGVQTQVCFRPRKGGIASALRQVFSSTDYILDFGQNQRNPFSDNFAAEICLN